MGDAPVLGADGAWPNINAMAREAYQRYAATVGPRRCICGAAWELGESCTDHTEIVCFGFDVNADGATLTDIRQGGTGDVLWERPRDE